ncbi:MAG TPA: PQQ-binding-like beta-propeller repeat protein [Bryobacteraceae bacterium]|nr:PQQ-binding-like beta-propeller repeat protein [Bryobacteraceae bacterium]
MRAVAVLIGAAVLAVGSDWPRYRGPNGTGVSDETGLPAEFSKDKNVVWTAKIPRGNSSPVVLGSRVYLTAHEGEARMLLCLDANSGKQIWQQSINRSRTETPHPLNGFTTPSVATDGKLLFVYYPEVGLLAYDLDGKEQWRVPLASYGAVQGMAVSPVYADGKVMLLVDTPEEAFVTAWHAASGKEAWKVERPSGFLGSYATPSLWKPVKGGTQLIAAGAVELTAYDVATGKRVWWARDITNAPAALPLVAGDSVYTLEPAGEGAPPFAQMANAYDKNKDGKVDISTEVSGDRINDKIMYRLFSAIDKHYGDRDNAVTEAEYLKSFSPDNPAGGLVRTRLGGTGDVSKNAVVWRHRKGLPYVTAALLYAKTLYVVRDGGIVMRVDPETGKVIDQNRLKDAVGQYYASPVAADGKVYFVSKDGKTTVVKASPEWTIMSSGDLGEDVIATPAISGKRLFVRTASALYCFGAAA